MKLKKKKNCSELHAYCHILPGLPYCPFNRHAVRQFRLSPHSPRYTLYLSIHK